MFTTYEQVLYNTYINNMKKASRDLELDQGKNPEQTILRNKHSLSKINNITSHLIGNIFVSYA